MIGAFFDSPVTVPGWALTLTGTGAVILLLVCVGLVIWIVRLCRYLEAVEERGESNRDDYDLLREEVGKFIGWKNDGTLPDKPAKQLQEFLSNQLALSNSTAAGAGRIFEVIGQHLKDMAAEIRDHGRSNSTMTSGHDRLVDLFEDLAEKPDLITGMLERSAVQFLVQTAMQLDVYYPSSPFRDIYNLALAAITYHAAHADRMLSVARPMTILPKHDVEIAYEDYNTVLDDPRVLERARMEYDLLSQSERRDTHVLVVDCIAPGLTGGPKPSKPQVIVFDRNWT